MWAANIAYIPMQRGLVYLCAIPDWAWQLSKALTTDVCVGAVQEAISRYGTPESFNTNQGCWLTS